MRCGYTVGSTKLSSKRGATGELLTCWIYVTCPHVLRFVVPATRHSLTPCRHGVLTLARVFVRVDFRSQDGTLCGPPRSRLSLAGVTFPTCLRRLTTSSRQADNFTGSCRHSSAAPDETTGGRATPAPLRGFRQARP